MLYKMFDSPENDAHLFSYTFRKPKRITCKILRTRKNLSQIFRYKIDYKN